MRCKFKHLTYTDRLLIEKLFNKGVSKVKISEVLSCNLDTVYRELKRGYYNALDTNYNDIIKYSADIAQQDYDYKATGKGCSLKIDKYKEYVTLIEHLIINKKYSPAAALAYIRNTCHVNICCVNTLYNYIDKGVFLHVTNKHLLEKTNKKRKYTHVKKQCRASAGTSIEKRPEYINNIETFGHWEMDTVIGKAKGVREALLVLTERLTRYEIIIKLKNKSSSSVASALDHLQQQYCFDIFKSITVDNGTEFSNCYRLEHDKKGNKRTQLYYCHVYCSSERGRNERQNRIIRRFYPKGQSLKSVTNKDVQRIAYWINNLPRKVLNWQCSSELFNKYIADIA